MWVDLYQWGDAIDVRGDGRAKRLGTPEIDDCKKWDKDQSF
jgi:hypothetical protein